MVMLAILHPKKIESRFRAEKCNVPLKAMLAILPVCISVVILDASQIVKIIINIRYEYLHIDVKHFLSLL